MAKGPIGRFFERVFGPDATPVPTHVPSTRVSRMYQAAQSSRLTAGWTTATSSADSEIRTSLTALRARSRALCRDSAYAKRARTIVVNNVIGSGIGLQGQVRSTRNRPLKRVNAGIEAAWDAWCRADSCHTGGELHFCDFERALMGEVFEAGEVFVRIHRRPFGGSKVPLALELIESERVPHEIQPAATRPNGGNAVRMGIEVDRFGRPVRYWIRDRHPSETQFAPAETGSERIRPVPAEEILHLRIIDRWPQTRGVPWLHAVAKKLNDMDGYSEAEIVAARGSANYAGTIELDPVTQVGEEQDDGTREIEVAPGIWLRLNPGEKMNWNNPNRPNTALDPFMRYMLRETAAGTGVSYESLSRDYSQSNYSSSRLALLDDRDNWRVLQRWFIRTFREAVHPIFLQQAVFARAIDGLSVRDYALNIEKFRAAKFKPRGWSWVDPTKEVAAFKEAIRAGLTTQSAVIAATGGGDDIEDVLEERARELEMAAEMGLKFDTEAVTAPAASASNDDDRSDDDDDQDDDDTNQPMRVVK